MWRPLLALGLGLTLALCFDQAVRLVLTPESTDRPWYLQTVQYHPILGWSGYPNYTETNDGIRIETNSLGYRDREPVDTTEGQTLRVLFLGDSFTWGDEVNVDERFTSVLEAPCEAPCEAIPRIHAINRAIIGYGTAQSFLQYVLARRDERADVVILGLFTGNDLSDNAVVDSPSGPRPRLMRCPRGGAGQELCLDGVPVPPVVDWPEHRVIDPRGAIARHLGWSGVIALATQRRAPAVLIEGRIAADMDEALHALPFPIVERASQAPIDDPISQLEAILAGLNRAIREDGRAFGVLVFPSARLYGAGESGTEGRDYGEVVSVLERLGIPFVDYYEQTKRTPWEELFFGVDGHWRPRGHLDAARLLRPLLTTLPAQAEGGLSSPERVPGAGQGYGSVGRQ